MNWGALRIAVIGGDEREVEIARRAALTGAMVTGYGFPSPEGVIEGVELRDDPVTAASGADYALLPIPGLDHGRVFAPANAEPIEADAALVGALAPGAAIVMGTADGRLRAAAATAGVDLLEYEGDKVLMLERGPAIVEGAIERAIAVTDVTIHGAEVAVIGQGTIGTLLARTLLALGARVTVFARNPEQRAQARASGCTAAPLDDLLAAAPHTAMVFSTVPAPVVGAGVLATLPPGSLVMDLAAPPGGVELGEARRRGHVAVWARGLGRRAPVTVGASQWGGVRQRIESRETARSER